MVEVFDEVTTS